MNTDENGCLDSLTDLRSFVGKKWGLLPLAAWRLLLERSPGIVKNRWIPGLLEACGQFSIADFIDVRCTVLLRNAIAFEAMPCTIACWSFANTSSTSS